MLQIPANSAGIRKQIPGNGAIRLKFSSEGNFLVNDFLVGATGGAGTQLAFFDTDDNSAGFVADCDNYYVTPQSARAVFVMGYFEVK